VAVFTTSGCSPQISFTSSKGSKQREQNGKPVGKLQYAEDAHLAKFEHGE
jgi:hypothetical protein